MDGRLRNYIYFRVQNTIQISTDPRCLLIKDTALNIIVILLLSKYHFECLMCTKSPF